MRRSIVWRLALTTALVWTLLLFAKTQMDFIYANF
jgi:hypothetical protein